MKTKVTKTNELKEIKEKFETTTEYRETALEAKQLFRKIQAAAAAYAAAAKDQILSEFAEDVTKILIDMNTPGSKFLDTIE